ncbi:unnamed protein product [Lactuca saligna]|uniref:Uncharacterized protein n=1 Tax=Lactuca saligna TaxID=75948 RepID=A0AA35ZCP6_LACSI|nr:unnamed protein product [Lactuca saligna]
MSKIKNDKVKKGNFTKNVSIESLRQTQTSSKKDKAKGVVQTRSKKSKKSVVEQPKVNLTVKGNKLVLEKVKIVCKKRELYDEEKIRFLEDILQEDGGFGCGDVNGPYVEEECQEFEYNEEDSGGDEDLCAEDEEEFDVSKFGVVEVYETKISYMYHKMEDLKKDLVVKINQQIKEPILTPAFCQVNDDEESIKVNDDEDYGNGFLKDHENVEDDDQGKCGGAKGDGNRAHKDHIDKNDAGGKVDGAKGDVDDHAYEDHIGKNNDLLNEKDDDVMMENFGNEDDEQGNGSGCNEKEAMNLNSIAEYVTKSVGLINSQEGVSFSQLMCDLVVESFLKILDRGTVNLGEDDHSKEVISDHIVHKVIVEKKKEDELIDPSLLKGCAKVLVEISKLNKDGEGVVEGDGVEVDSILGKAIEDCSNENKDMMEVISL